MLQKYTFVKEGKSTSLQINKKPNVKYNNDESTKTFKTNLIKLFKEFGYIDNGKDYEIKFRTTSGNVAWVNINSIETIK